MSEYAGSCSSNEPSIEKNNRRSRWVSSLAALKYFGQSYSDDSIKTRVTDRVTNILFAIAIITGTIWLLVAQNNVGLAALCDLFFGVTILFYLANRFGILTMLTARQAVLVGELLAGFTLFGIYCTANFVAIITWLQSLLRIHQ